MDKEWPRGKNKTKLNYWVDIRKHPIIIYVLPTIVALCEIWPCDYNLF